MIKKQRTFGVILVLFLLSAALAAAVGIRLASAGDQVERPFRMQSNEYVVNEGPDAGDCDFVTVIIEGAGVATHMGAVKINRSHCFSPLNDPPFYDGVWEAEGADGDKVYGTYEGYMNFTEFDDNNNPIRGEIIGVYSITGGTGRFEGASGSGSMTGDYDLVADSGDFLTEGTITY